MLLPDKSASSSLATASSAGSDISGIHSRNRSIDQPALAAEQLVMILAHQLLPHQDRPSGMLVEWQ